MFVRTKLKPEACIIQNHLEKRWRGCREEERDEKRGRKKGDGEKWK